MQLTPEEKIKKVIEYIINQHNISPKNAPIEIRHRYVYPISFNDVPLIIKKLEMDEKILSIKKEGFIETVGLYSIVELLPGFDEYCKGILEHSEQENILNLSKEKKSKSLQNGKIFP